ncbi:MFS transporter [Rhodopila sp.]|uniref:MFS transporter n=1 Tax=Rhodopila sp. TaxID=2480087 RepID=UPI003D14B7B6
MPRPAILETAIANPPAKARARRTLALASLAHATHDGLTDMIYVLLPVWQTQFALDYGALAVLRALYVGALAVLQVPAGHLARYLNARTVLALGTLLCAAGYALAGLSGSLAGLCAALAVAGAGGATQHPLASAAVSSAYSNAARGPLGTYNFAGDLGKAAIPPAVSLLLTVTDWRTTLWVIAGLGSVVALLIRWLMPPVTNPPAVRQPTPSAATAGKGGFGLLLAIGVLDSAARMGFLLFLPFLLQAKGAPLTTIGLALSLVFIGGACGKAACGWFGARAGLPATVIATEVGTAAAILTILALPLAPTLAALPLLGLLLNGTSSVLYGTVPEFAASAKLPRAKLPRAKFPRAKLPRAKVAHASISPTSVADASVERASVQKASVAPAKIERASIERAFALFYTGTLGSSALAPVLYGWVGDAAGPAWATTTAAATALAVVPLAVLLSPRLASVARADHS